MTNSPVVAVVQARMGSTRLPGKSLASLGDDTVLGWVLRRLARARALDRVVVATSLESADDAVEREASGHGIDVVRGSLHDVLARFHTAAVATGAATVVRVTADCPLLDPAVVDATVNALQSEAADYASTNLAGPVVHGLDCEAFLRGALDAAAAEATDAVEREHVTPFLYRRPERFRCVPVQLPSWAARADVRLTVDEAADLELIRRVVATLGAGPDTLDAQAAVELVASDPELRALVAGVRHRLIPVLRRVRTTDSALLLAWRNDQDAVRFSRSGRGVAPEQHERWLAGRLTMVEPALWLAEVQGEPVGHIRIDDIDGVPTVSLVVAPEHRGQGVASAMLAALIALRPTQSLDAVIHRDNAASLAAFRRAGFAMVTDDPAWLRFRRTP